MKTLQQRDSWAARYKIEIAKNGKFVFYLIAPGGAKLIKSIPYASIAACYNGITNMQKHSQTEIIEDENSN